MNRSPLYLSRHAFLCLADRNYVFLDLRTDRYLCLGRAHTSTLGAVLDGRHVVDGHLDKSEAWPVIEALLQKGLLVQDEMEGKPAAPPRVDVAVANLIDRPDEPGKGIRPAHVLKFFAASAAASIDLRRRSIERTVRKVEVRKSAKATHPPTLDEHMIIHLFEIFQTLRPCYPRPYLCLFDSLALLNFLAFYDVFPQWVYGIKLEPFAAHCWVQVGDRVVNDIIDNVRDYKPIMSV